MQPEGAAIRRNDADRFVVARLRDAGVVCGSVWDFVTGATPAAAVPVLLELLDVVEEEMILQGIVRALRTKAAKGRAEEPLIALFRQLPSTTSPGLKWAIANTLGGLDRQRYARELLELALDSVHGTDRQMIVDALSTLKGGHITDALISLLDDDDVSGHAIGALRQRHAKEAIPVLKTFEGHPNAWKRRSAARAVKAIISYHSTRH